MLADDVTVVIPTHNRIGYLNRALNSVLGRFEHIIIVDDGSKVAVGDAIRVSVGQSCSLFRNERAKGAAAARNLGCQRVVTEWILFLDDDDMIIPDAKNRYEVAIQSAPEVDVWFGGIPCRKCSSLLTPVLRSHLTRRNMPGGCSGVLMRKAVFDSVGGFDVAMYSMQDWDLWIRLFQQAKLSFLGVDVVAYEHGSPGKITHNLSSKYCGLRRLLWKHRGGGEAFSSSSFEGSAIITKRPALIVGEFAPPQRMAFFVVLHIPLA